MLLNRVVVVETLGVKSPLSRFTDRRWDTGVDVPDTSEDRAVAVADLDMAAATVDRGVVELLDTESLLDAGGLIVVSVNRAFLAERATSGAVTSMLTLRGESASEARCFSCAVVSCFSRSVTVDADDVDSAELGRAGGAIGVANADGAKDSLREGALDEAGVDASADNPLAVSFLLICHRWSGLSHEQRNAD